MPLNDSPLTTSRRLMSFARSTKTLPSLSVTTASVPARNCIPFPSLPIQCAQFDDDVICTESFSSWHPDLQRRSRSQSLLTISYFRPRITPNLRLPIGKSGAYMRRESLPSDGPVLYTMGNGSKKVSDSIPCRKVGRKGRGVGRSTKSKKPSGKRLTLDPKFLATLHKSITWRIMCVEGVFADTDIKDRDRVHDHALSVQDKLLAQKLGNRLAECGHDPHNLLHESPLTHPSNSTLAFTAFVGLSVGDTTLIACSPSDSLSSTTSLYPFDNDSSNLTVSPPGILTMSQAVASLILRHRERTSGTRPRLLPSQLRFHCRTSTGCERKSPLSKVLCLVGV